MAKKDINQVAKRVVDQATGDAPKESIRSKASRIAGAKGGTARALKLTDERKAEISELALSARFKKS